jgi:Polyketide cyclase / dehydrase and lipid transport.
MTYTYRMSDPNIKALPASSYSATLVVTPKDGGSQIEWYARVYRADTGNEPPEGQTDADAKNALSALLKTGLAGIKSKVEAKS